MGKGNGGTRSNGVSTGGVVAAPVDEYAEWRARESTERFTYDPDKVKFEVQYFLDDTTDSDARYKADYAFYEVQRNMRDGKYHIVDDRYYVYDERMTFNQAVNRAIKDIKASYKHNEGLHDRIVQVESEDDNAPTANIWVELTGNNKLRLSVDKFKL